MLFSRLDTSNELHVYRFGNGIKLIKPINKDKNRINYGWYTNHTVSTLLQTPCSIYFDNTNGVIQQLNERNIELCRFDSSKQAIGKKYFCNLTSKTVRSLLQNDREVIKHQKIQIVEENIMQINNDSIDQVLSLKMPWYNNLNKVIGLFGCSITLGKDSLANSLALIAEMGLFIPINNLHPHVGIEMNGVYLSKQQRICAKSLLRGISIKEIAVRMNLSPRTIETYIDNMKSKFRCGNRTELIIKLYEIMQYEYQYQ